MHMNEQDTALKTLLTTSSQEYRFMTDQLWGRWRKLAADGLIPPDLYTYPLSLINSGRECFNQEEFDKLFKDICVLFERCRKVVPENYTDLNTSFYNKLEELKNFAIGLGLIVVKNQFSVVEDGPADAVRITFAPASMSQSNAIMAVKQHERFITLLRQWVVQPKEVPETPFGSIVRVGDGTIVRDLPQEQLRPRGALAYIANRDEMFRSTSFPTLQDIHNSINIRSCPYTYTPELVVLLDSVGVPHMTPEQSWDEIEKFAKKQGLLIQESK